MPKENIDSFTPKSQADWRKWLEKNHASKDAIWLIIYKVSTKIPSVKWGDAVDEALCFGWIDSTKKSIDKDSYMQYYSKRKPNSTWSKINKDKVVKLIQNKQMTKAGLACIDIAKKNGSWTILDDVEKLIIPEDLKKAFDKNKGALEFFQRQSKYLKKAMLYWVVSAKRAATREKRILDIADSAAAGVLPKRFT